MIKANNKKLKENKLNNKKNLITPLCTKRKAHKNGTPLVKRQRAKRQANLLTQFLSIAVEFKDSQKKKKKNQD